jgi:hypothetical protein
MRCIASVMSASSLRTNSIIPADGDLFFKYHDTFLTSLLIANAVIFSCSAKHCASQKISPVCGARTYSFLIFREHKAQVVSVRGARSLTKTNLI